METEVKDYVVTVHKHEDLESLYSDLEMEGGGEYVPDRCVECSNRRPISRNTVYKMTDEEAEALKVDPRVLAVEPDHSDMVIRRPFWERIGNFHKGSTNNSAYFNWGLARSTAQSTKAGWGSDGTATNNQTVTTLYDGEGVDLVIVDGFIDPTHPEFAVNADGTGGSRVEQFNWFSLRPKVTGGAAGTYVYGPYTGDDNNHGAHVAGIAAGNRHGWAPAAKIYNLYPYGGSGNQGVGADWIDYIRVWHEQKTNTRPTVVNNSWGSFYSFPITGITSLNWRGTTITPAGSSFTVNELATYGVYCEGSPSEAIVLYYSAAEVADLEDAIYSGIIFVGAAGNDDVLIDVSGGIDFNNTVLYGGFNYNYHRGSSNTSGANAICVGAADATIADQKATFSNKGPRVDIFAPGVNIMSAVNTSNAFGLTTVGDPRNSSYSIVKLQGTSMASPQVAGMIAAFMGQWKSLTNDPAAQVICREFMQANGVSTLANPAPSAYTNNRSLMGASNHYSTYSEYKLGVDNAPLNPGGSATYLLKTTNVPNGTQVDFNLYGNVVAGNFTSGGLSGSFTVTANSGSFGKTAASTSHPRTFTPYLSRSSSLLPSGGVVLSGPTNTLVPTSGGSPSSQTQYLRQDAVAETTSLSVLGNCQLGKDALVDDISVPGTLVMGRTRITPVEATVFGGNLSDQLIYQFLPTEQASQFKVTVRDLGNGDVIAFQFYGPINLFSLTSASDLWTTTPNPSVTVGSSGGYYGIKLTTYTSNAVSVAVEVRSLFLGIV